MDDVACQNDWWCVPGYVSPTICMAVYSIVWPPDQCVASERPWSRLPRASPFTNIDWAGSLKASSGSVPPSLAPPTCTRVPSQGRIGYWRSQVDLSTTTVLTMASCDCPTSMPLARVSVTTNTASSRTNDWWTLCFIFKRQKVRLTKDQAIVHLAGEYWH